MRSFFKKLTLFFSFLYITAALHAQQNHFIYLQTENKQPFYIKLDKKILSSSAAGYLIIPKLQDGTYTLTLGFPKNEWPEQKVTCNIDKKDAGYIVKNFGDKGWGLYNWQSMNLVMAETKQSEPVVAAEVKKEAPVVVKTEAPVQELPNAAVAEEPKKQDMAKPVSVVKRLLNNRSAEGVEMIFTDAANGLTDTIRVFIPADKKAAVPLTAVNDTLVKENPVKEKEQAVQPSSPAVTMPQQKEEIKKDTVTVVQEKKTEPVVVAPKEEPAIQPAPKEQPKTGISNSDCKAFATEDDFMKLRKKMAAADNDDDMVAAARKVFKAKCFTVEQVKNLSVLFLHDDGRYKFFDAAYPFVSDSYNFSSLQQLLTDDYYITRFKAMIRH